MRKSLLMVLFAGSYAASAQTITADDTLYTGLSKTFYVLDSTAANLDAITGTGVTWDYSAIMGVAGVAANSEDVTDAATSSYAADFPNSDYNDYLSNNASVFFTNSADSMTVQGFVFDIQGTTAIIKHTVNPMIAMKYPMSVGDYYTDATAGTVSFGATTGTTAGTVNVIVDGSGTLKVGPYTHTGIVRVKLVESIATSIIVFGMPVSGTVTRTIYSYYDFADSQLPVFIHATIDVNTTALSDNYTAVYYDGIPNYAGIETAEPVSNFSVYPNPATDVVTVSTDGKAQSLKVINALGQVVLNLNNPQAVEVLDASAFEPGIYVVQIQNAGVTTEQKLVIR